MLSDDIVNLRLFDNLGRLRNVGIKQKPALYYYTRGIHLTKQETYRVNTEPNTNMFPNIEIDEKYEKKFFMSFKYQQAFDTYNPSLRWRNPSSSYYSDYQLIYDALDKTAGKSVPIDNFHLEIGGIKKSGQVLITGIADFSGYGGGVGVSVGKVFYGGEVFRFIPALNLGCWANETSYKEHSDLPLDLNWDKFNRLFGGPELRIMLGYKFIFADLGMKCMMGFSDDYFSVKVKVGSGYYSYYDTRSSDTHFNAMFGWNIGLTFMF